MLSNVPTRLLLGELVLYPAEVDGSNAQVGGNIVLRHPLDDMRPFFYKIFIPLLGSVADAGEKFVHIMVLSLERYFQQYLHKFGVPFQFAYHLGKMFFGEDLDRGGFDRLYRKDTGGVVLKAFERSDAFVLEKELEGRILLVVVEPYAETALFDEIVIFCNLPFF